jgi:hypothetical protein
MANDTDEKEAEKARRPILPKFGKKKTTTIRRPSEDLDEIDERELDQVAGGRMYRVDF